MSSWTFFIFPTLKGSPHTNSGLGFPCGSLCSLYQDCVTVMAQRQLLDDEKGLVSTQAAALLFSPLLLPIFSGYFPASTFPTCSAQEPRGGSKPSSQKTMSFSTISRGRGWSSQFPGLWKDFLPFTCPGECSLVLGTQPLQPGVTLGLWLGFLPQPSCMTSGKKSLVLRLSQGLFQFIPAVLSTNIGH